MSEKPAFSREEILSILPHRPPFMFVDRVMKLEPNQWIIAERELRADEPQFVGHFPGRPIMPGVLVTEALAQTSGLLLGLSDQATGADTGSSRMFFLAASQMKFTHPAVPGDVLILRADRDANFGGLFRFRVEATAGRNLIASGNLTLARVEST